MTDASSGFAPINGARIYFETAGAGPPFVMIHAGVADNRQWNNEFAHYAARHRVVRFDLRGFGRSEPVAGDFAHLADLEALLAHLAVDRPMILMGCSMGGGLAMDFAFAHPSDVAALIMVGSGPAGLVLPFRELVRGLPWWPFRGLRWLVERRKHERTRRAIAAGDIDRVTELETQTWFDGVGRGPDQVDPAMRRLAYEMNRTALSHQAKELGARNRDSDVPAADHLRELDVPVLVIVGEHDIGYLHAAAKYMVERLPTVEKALMKDAAHLPNMDHPHEFAGIVDAFLARHVERAKR